MIGVSQCGIIHEFSNIVRQGISDFPKNRLEWDQIGDQIITNLITNATAEKAGFEPTVGYPNARFQDGCLQPLSHFSKLKLVKR